MGSLARSEVHGGVTCSARARVGTLHMFTEGTLNERAGLDCSYFASAGVTATASPTVAEGRDRAGEK